MGKYRYFELDEFVRSDTARKRGIINTPTFEAVEHLDELVSTILEPMRAAYGRPITVTSGYRCPALNLAVGGVPNSAHLYGYAADLRVSNNFALFKKFAEEWLRKTGTKFDQLLLERDKHGVEWVHIGIRNALGQQRGQIKLLYAD